MVSAKPRQHPTRIQRDDRTRRDPPHPAGHKAPLSRVVPSSRPHESREESAERNRINDQPRGRGRDYVRSENSQRRSRPVDGRGAREEPPRASSSQRSDPGPRERAQSTTVTKRVLQKDNPRKHIQAPRDHRSEAPPAAENRSASKPSSESETRKSSKEIEHEEPEFQDASSQDGDEGIYGEEVDLLIPSRKGGVMSYEVRMPVYQTSEASEGGHDSPPPRPSRKDNPPPSRTDVPPEEHRPVSTLRQEEPVTTTTTTEMLDDLFESGGSEVLDEIELPEVPNPPELVLPEAPEIPDVDFDLPLVSPKRKEKSTEMRESDVEKSMDISSSSTPPVGEEDMEEEPSPPEEEDPVVDPSPDIDNNSEDMYDDDEEPEVSDTVRGDFDDEGAAPLKKGELEEIGTMDDAFKYARSEFEDTLALTKRYADTASMDSSTYPAFQGFMTSTRNRIHMVKENIDAFRDTFMHAVFIELRAKCKILIRKGTLPNNKEVSKVLKTLDRCIEMVKDKARDYQKHFYQELFLPSILNRVVRNPIYPFVPILEGDGDDDELPNYLNPIGKLIQQVITRGILSLQVTDDPFELLWESWENIDLEAWDVENKALCKTYRKKSVVKGRSKTRGAARKRLKSPLECALTGIPIFAGDMVHAARLVFRDSLSGISKNTKHTVKEATHCLLFHAEVLQYISPPEKGESADEDESMDDEEEEIDEKEMWEASHVIITNFFNSLSIIGDSYYHGEDDRALDYSKGTTVWFMSQARSMLASIELPVTEEPPIKFILSNTSNLEYFMEEVLFLSDYLESFGKIYAQHKFAIYNVRHLLGMNE